MASSFYAPQTVTVELGGGNTVTLRKLTYGEVGELLSEVQTDAVRYTMLQVERGVVSWAGPGFEGREPSAENIRALPVKVGRKLGKAAAALNEDVTDDEGN